MQIITDSNNLKTTQPKLQMKRADYTQAQNLNQKQFNSRFVNILEETSSVSTDEEDCNEIPPNKILRIAENSSNTGQQPSLQDSMLENILAEVSTDEEDCNEIPPKKMLRIAENSSNTGQQPCLQDLATFRIRNSQNVATSAEHCSGAAATSTTNKNAANQENCNVAENLLQMNKSEHQSSNSHFNNDEDDNHQQLCDLKESRSQYSHSPTTTSTTEASSPSLPESTPPAHALAMLKMDDTLLYIKDRVTIIGRNSTTSKVDFHVANSSFVSRKHFQIDFDPDCGEFFLTCGSKNGIFVDDDLQRCNAPPTKLPKTCSFRFPSTELLIHFDNYVYKNPSRRQKNCNLIVPLKTELPEVATFNVHQADNINGAPTPSCSSSTTDGSVMLKKKISDQSNDVYSTLKISIPNLEAHSNPYPSPTGTISAANSCPASPRHSFPDYQTFCGNGNRNNLNNDDAFRPPSTSSYNETEKPPYSYAQLIIQSISSAPDKQLTLSGIYTFISKNYPYYRMEANKGWQNSIRHNLSLNRYFIKVARSQDEPGKGSFWRIDPNSEAKLIDSSFKTRRQRSVVSFKRPFQGMPHSAPVSPSQRDMSLENSPLQDLSLQSAPGSPEITMIKEESYDDQQSSEELESVGTLYNTDDQYK